MVQRKRRGKQKQEDSKVKQNGHELPPCKNATKVYIGDIIIFKINSKQQIPDYTADDYAASYQDLFFKGDELSDESDDDDNMDDSDFDDVDNTDNPMFKDNTEIEPDDFEQDELADYDDDNYNNEEDDDNESGDDTIDEEVENNLSDTEDVDDEIDDESNLEG